MIELESIGQRLNMTAAQASLAWLLHQRPNILPIPGTRYADRAQDNLDAVSIRLSDEDLAAIGAAVNPDNIVGERYNDVVMREVDAERHRFA